MKWFIISFLLVFSFFSCGVKKPSKYDFLAERVLSQNDSIHANYAGPITDIREELASVDALSGMSESKFADKFFQETNGDVNRFFLKDNKEVYVWEGRDRSYVLSPPSDYPFGLVRGQSKDDIFYYNPSAKGTNFAVYNMHNKSYEVIKLEDFIVINVSATEVGGRFLVSGVKKNESGNTLGFYWVSKAEPRQYEKLHSLPLTAEPSGDPGIYDGKFYTLGDNIYYLFDHHSDIFEFDSHGKYIRTINTVDQFTFKNEKEGNNTPDFDKFYTDILTWDDLLIVQTNLHSTVDKYVIVFDVYDKVKGAYKKSVKVIFEPLVKQEVNTVWTFVKDGVYHMLFGKGYSSVNYKEFQLDLRSIKRLTDE